MAFNPFQWTISSFISESVHNIKETPSCRRSPSLFRLFFLFSFLPLFFPLARISIWFETCSSNLLLSLSLSLPPPCSFPASFSAFLPVASPPSFQTGASHCLAVWEEKSQLSRNGEEPNLDPGAGRACYTVVTQWLNKYWEK